MDKRYYYRMLGLQEGATRAQIDAAYQKKIKNLQSADYADDPEYAHKKMVQTRNAYKVLTGASVPATKAQREDRFERIKDALDGGEDSVRKEKRRIHREHTIEDSPIGGIKNMASKVGNVVSDIGEQLGGKEKSDKGASDDTVKAIITIIGVMVCLFSTIVSSCDVSDNLYSEPYYEYIEEDGYYNENFDDPYSSRMAAMNSFGSDFDYYSGLDYDSVEEYENLIRWDSIEETAVEEQLYELAEYLDAPGYDYREMILEFTGDEYYLEDADVSECIDIITDWLWAPTFEDVAGATEPYYNMPIISYADYLRYLNNVIAEQAPDIWGEEL